MKIQKMIGASVLAAIAMVGLNVGANADTSTVVSYSSLNPANSTVFTFDSSSATLTVNPTTGFEVFANQGPDSATANFVFGPVSETGPVSTVTGVSAPFSGGTFSFKAVGGGTLGGIPYIDGQTLLSGGFTSSVLSASGLGVGSAAELNLSDVTYDNSTPFALLFAAKHGSSPIPPTAFSIGMSSLDNSNGTPGPTLAGNGNFASFTAGGSAGTFSGSYLNTAVPEPSSVAAFAFTGMGLLGLMLFARKRRSAMTA